MRLTMCTRIFSRFLFLPLQISFLMIAFLNTSLFPQSDTIIEIYDNGKYITAKGDTITPYSIVVPSKKQSEKYGASILAEINQWTKEYLLGEVFTISKIDSFSSKSFSAKIFRERFTGQQDFGELLVDMGFAEVDPTFSDSYSKSLKQIQLQAIKSQKGIWRIFKPALSATDPYSNSYSNYETSSGLKFATLATLALSTILTWDYAIQVSDLSEAIDDAKKIKDYDTGPLERERTRKIIYTAVCGVTAVISFYLAIDSFEISTKNNKLNFSYKF